METNGLLLQETLVQESTQVHAKFSNPILLLFSFDTEMS